MASPSEATTGASPAVTTPAPIANVPGMVLLAWLVPGAAHLVMGQARRGLTFLLALVVMFVCGVAFGGRLFPFQAADPLVFLAAAGEWGLGGGRLLAALAGWGDGLVAISTYEYGNTFLIAAGLLNMLVVLDAADLAAGRRPR